jgi:hypothetical protein
MPLVAYMKALPLILTGIALNYYYNTQLALLTFNDTYKSLYNFFKGLGTKRQALDK